VDSLKLWEFIIRRLVLLIPVLFGLSLVTFGLTHFAGDPCAAYVTERMSDDQIRRVCQARGFDEPVYEQYRIYVTNLLKGDLGYSKSAHQDVSDAFWRYFPMTAELTILSMLLAVAVGVPLGVFSAVRRDTMPDHLTRVIALSGVSLPVFWLALLLQYFLGYVFPILPLAGPYTPSLALTHPVLQLPSKPTGFLLIDTAVAGDWTAFLDHAAHLVLPTFVLGYLTLAVIVRLMRSSMLEEMGQDYVRTARAKGVPESVVVRHHARRNALIPTTTVIGLAFAGLLGGAVLTESVFALPGLGRWSTGAFVLLDQAAVMAFVLFAGIVFILVNLIVDVAYALLDPRIRLGG
jgi:ABC-type dipeptide/oligopeptide/nickel transport system permease component